MQFTIDKVIQAIDSYLKRTGKSATDLGRESGIGQPAISRIKNKDTDDPRIKTLYALAHHMGITVSQLIGETPVNNNDPLNALLDIDHELFVKCCNAVKAAAPVNTTEEMKAHIIKRLYHDFENHPLRYSADLDEMLKMFADKYFNL